KDAVRAAWNEKYGEALFPADMETELVDGRIVCRRRGQPKAEPFPPVSVAIAEGKVAGFSAFAERVGLALLSLKKSAPEAAVREAPARLAAAAALRIAPDGLPVEPGSPPGSMLVTPAGRRLRVQTARQKDVIVATTLCEAEPT